MDNDSIERAIAVNVEALGYLRSGQRNAAIGTIIDIGGMLAAASALHAAALALHRRTLD